MSRLSRTVLPLATFLLVLSPPPFAQEVGPRQILVETNIWEIQESSNFDYGIIWDLEDFNPEFNDILESSIFLPGINQVGGNVTGAFVTATRNIFEDGVLADQLRMTLQAAVRNGSVQLRANPKIVVIEGQSGVIHSGEQVPVVEWRAPNSRTPGTLQTVYKDIGIKLEVVPKVFRDEFVLLSVRPTVKDIIGFAEKDSSQGRFVLPIYSDRTINSVVLVRSGSTLILSGILSEQRRLSSTEVPYVAQIPVLGWLFRSRNSEWTRSDILIEVTPTILHSGQSGSLPTEFMYQGDIFQSDTEVKGRVDEARESRHEPSASTGAPGSFESVFESAESGSIDGATGNGPEVQEEP